MFKYFEVYTFNGESVKKEYNLDIAEIAEDYLDYCDYWKFNSSDEATFCDYLVDEIVEHMENEEIFDNSNLDDLWNLVKKNL